MCNHLALLVRTPKIYHFKTLASWLGHCIPQKRDNGIRTKKSDYIELLRTPLEILTRHCNRHPLIIIAGDFNYLQLCCHSDDVVEPVDAASSAVLDIRNDFHLPVHPFVHLPTKFGRTSSSVLYLALSSYLADISKVTVEHQLSEYKLAHDFATLPENSALSER